MESLVELLRNYASFSRVVPFDPATDKLFPFDFTANNQELTAEILNDINLFAGYINTKLKRADAKYGIGGYGEHRTIYSRSPLFDATGSTEEPRRLHLGIDIWGPANTAVMAPLDGEVHNVANNKAAGDYGATVILRHELNGIEFYTLYGHLSLASLQQAEGKQIKKGSPFAELGIPAENGQWPPHLHFQVIKNLGNNKGDYPGVCRYSEKEKYMQNCPDPELLLRMQSP